MNRRLTAPQRLSTANCQIANAAAPVHFDTIYCEPLATRRIQWRWKWIEKNNIFPINHQSQLHQTERSLYGIHSIPSKYDRKRRATASLTFFHSNVRCCSFRFMRTNRPEHLQRLSSRGQHIFVIFFIVFQLSASIVCCASTVFILNVTTPLHITKESALRRPFWSSAIKISFLIFFFAT